MNGWTDGEDKYMAISWCESIYEPRPEAEGQDEREEPEAEAVPEELEVGEAMPEAPKVPVRRAARVPTFEFTGAQWDAFLARACKPQPESQKEPPAGRVA
jgi:hypothetical protein